MLQEVAQRNDGEHFSRGVKNVKKMVSYVLQGGRASSAKQAKSSSGGRNVGHNCDVIRCSLTFDTPEMLRSGFESIVRNCPGVLHVVSTMGLFM